MLRSEVASEIAVENTGLIHRVYLPEKVGDLAVLLVHGRAGDARVMWLFSKVLQKYKPFVVAPQAVVPDAVGGWSWWDVDRASGDGGRSTGLSELEQAMSQLERFIVGVESQYSVPMDKLLCFGFSQGAGLLSALSLKRPNLFRGVAMLSGFIPGVVFKTPAWINPAVESGVADLPKYFVFHGTEDQVVPLDRAHLACRELRERDADVTYVEDRVGHKVSSAGIKALEAWVANFFE